MSLLDRAQHRIHLGAEPPQFASVQLRQFLEVRPALCGGGDEHPPGIRRIGMALQQIVVDGPADQFTSGMQAEVKPVGEIGQRGGRPTRLSATNGQQQLVLSGREALRSGGVLGEGQEAAESETEVGE